MTPQVKQVALTYLTRRSLWLLAAFALVGLGPTLLVGLADPKFRDSTAKAALFPLGFGSGMLAWILVTQAKWQFCDSRARLLPDFARSHLTALAGIIAIGFGAYPPLAAWAAGWNPLSVSACMVGIGASLLWSMHSTRGLPTALAIGQFLSLLTRPGIEFWVLPETAGRFAFIHIAIYVAGWVGVVAWFRRLTNLREEDCDYQIPIQAQQGSATRMERNSGRALAQGMTRNPVTRRISDRWHSRLQGMRAAAPRARQRLLAYGLSPTPAWFQAIPMGLWFFAIFWLTHRAGSFVPRDSPKGINPSIAIMMILPAFLSGAALTMRRARMASELLLPLTRRQYVHGVLAVAARNLACFWATTYLAILTLVWVATPEALTWPFVAGLTALSISAQLCGFALTTWSACFSSGAKRFALMIAGMWAVSVPLVVGADKLGGPSISREEAVARALAEAEADIREDYPPETRTAIEESVRESTIRRWEGDQPSPKGMWTMVALMTVAGLVVSIDARRRWLKLEFG